MIETKEQYEKFIYWLNQGDGLNDKETQRLSETIEALREVARTAKLVNRAYYPGEKLRGLVDDLPDWLVE